MIQNEPDHMVIKFNAEPDLMVSKCITINQTLWLASVLVVNKCGIL